MDNDCLCGVSTIEPLIANESIIYQALNGLSPIDQAIANGSPIDIIIDGPSVLFLECVE